MRKFTINQLIKGGHVTATPHRNPRETECDKYIAESMATIIGVADGIKRMHIIKCFRLYSDGSFSAQSSHGDMIIFDGRRPQIFHVFEAVEKA